MTQDKKPQPVKKPVPIKSLAEILDERRSRARIVEPISPERTDVPPVLKRAPAQPATLEPSDEGGTENFTGEIEVVEDTSLATEIEEAASATDTVTIPRLLFYVLTGFAIAGCIVIAVNVATLVARTFMPGQSADKVVLAGLEEPPAPPQPVPEPEAEPVPEPEPEPVPEPEPEPVPEPEPEPEPAPVVEEPPPPPVAEKPVIEVKKKPAKKPASKKAAVKKPKKKPAAKPKKKPAAKTKKKPEPKPVEKPKKETSMWELLD
ncbi:MAG: hypothetical protein JRG91_08040 [Deltaproteobacteria bacterium]|nr:hypothetical protein [Deltaproteobacteria bacterium]